MPVAVINIFEVIDIDDRKRGIGDTAAVDAVGCQLCDIVLIHETGQRIIAKGACRTGSPLS